MNPPSTLPLPGVFVAAFDSAWHRLRRGGTVDSAAATAHDSFAALDYGRVRGLGLRMVAESARWPLVEPAPLQYDFRPLRPFVRAARLLQLRIVWTLLDGSWPPDIDPMRPQFVRRLAAFARAFARFARRELDAPPVVIPIGRIGVRALLGGEVGSSEPFLQERGLELTVQLVRAAVAAADAIRAVAPDACIACLEPLFHVAHSDDRPQDIDAAAHATERRFEVTDMLCGHTWPQLGGDGAQLDILGVHVSPQSQWYYRGPKLPGPPIDAGAAAWRSLRAQLREASARAGKPLLIASSADRAALAPGWLRYVCREARSAMLDGVDIAGVMLSALDGPTPPGATRTSSGLWGAADEAGGRPVHAWLAAEVALQRGCFARLEERMRSAAGVATAGEASG